jgi:hypothetical protein
MIYEFVTLIKEWTWARSGPAAVQEKSQETATSS